MNVNNKKKYIISRIAACSVIAAAVLFIFISPRYYGDQLDNDEYKSWLGHEVEPYSGIISIWHIAGIKPFSGSLGALLYDEAKSYSKQFNNVYFDIKTYSGDEAAEQLKRGYYPDIVSFPKGYFSTDDLISICRTEDELHLKGAVQNECYALPYCASGYLLVFTAERAEDDINDLIGSSGSMAEFRSGKAASCITDIRGSGDLYRAQINGKCPYFEAQPLPESRFDAQFIGIHKTVDERKMSYITGFIERLIENEAQRRIADIGLIPVLQSVEAEYEQTWLFELRNMFSISKIENCF